MVEAERREKGHKVVLAWFDTEKIRGGLELELDKAFDPSDTLPRAIKERNGA